jgi:hypothetical protein
MQAPGVGFASDNDVAPVPGAVLCRVHVRGHVRGHVSLCGFFRLFDGLGVAAPSELHFLDHARRPLRW